MFKKEMWKFGSIQRIEEASFNVLLDDFYKMGLEALVRENIQNSLDAKDPNKKEPVIVSIHINNIPKNELPGINELESRIKELRGGNDYANEAISDMNKAISSVKSNDNINCLVFEDFNTKGLGGSKVLSSNLKSDSEDTYSIYAYKKGVHGVENDSNLEGIRGGSHGVGKIVSNAASSINLMYFSNYGPDEYETLCGSIQLIEHKYKGKYYRATGYFTEEKSGVYYPYQNKKFNEIFKKDTRGLKIVIPFLREIYSNLDSIIKVVCDNFFISILENKLVVKVTENEINKDTIYDFINDEKIYPNEDNNKNFTKLYIDTYKNCTSREISFTDYNKVEYVFNLFYRFDENITRGRLGIIRTIGMKIQDFKVKNHIKSSFNALILPKSIKEDVFLKSLENKSHTEISSDHIKDEGLRRNAKRFINNISKEMSGIISGDIKKNNPSGGEINTTDLLYSINRSFESNLKKVETVVEISNSKGKKELLKTSGSANPSKSKNKSNKSKGGLTLGTRKDKSGNRNGNGNGSKNKRKRVYNIEPKLVKRISTVDKEIIKLDFSKCSLYKEKYCDISIKILDGFGKESSDILDLKKTYVYITDSEKNVLNINNNYIKAVPINKDGTTSLILKSMDETSKYLKYKYIVEVNNDIY